jgi:GNAT superfamily N-acetyltransferase
MCDEWMQAVHLALSEEQFRQLPRNGAFLYDYEAGKAWLTPRPRFYHAVLPLPLASDDEAPAGGVSLRQLADEDLDHLVTTFSAAFRNIQPFAALDPATMGTAARAALDRTLRGDDGPCVRAASFVATSADSPVPVGAALVTLVPEGDPAAHESYHWQQPAPPDAVERRMGRAHLTWIFVDPLRSGRGTGTTLLRAATATLTALGYGLLFSTFLVGNDSSLLWHWRNGFRLLPYPTSRRRRPRADAVG